MKETVGLFSLLMCGLVLLFALVALIAMYLWDKWEMKKRQPPPAYDPEYWWNQGKPPEHNERGSSDDFEIDNSPTEGKS